MRRYARLLIVFVFAFAAAAAIYAPAVQARVPSPDIVCITYPCGEPTVTCVYASDKPAYQGWATIDRGGPCGGIRTMEIRNIQAWRWTGSSWASASLSESTRVYAWPYVTGWTWVWTQHTGWLAIRSGNVLVSKRYLHSPVHHCGQPAC